MQKQQKFSIISLNDVLKSVAAKFNWNLTFVQFFIGSFWQNIRMVILSLKNYSEFRTNTRIFPDENAAILSRKYLTLRGTKVEMYTDSSGSVTFVSIVDISFRSTFTEYYEADDRKK